MLASASSALLHVPCSRVCASHQTVAVFFGASTVTSLKYLALFVVGEMRLVYSRCHVELLPRGVAVWSVCG